MNPRGVNDKLENFDYPFNYSKAADVFKYTISNYNYGNVTDDYAKAFIIGAIDSGYPLLVGTAPDNTSKNTHFVTAYGDNGSTIYIHNPANDRDCT